VQTGHGLKSHPGRDAIRYQMWLDLYKRAPILSPRPAQMYVAIAIIGYMLTIAVNKLERSSCRGGRELQIALESFLGVGDRVRDMPAARRAHAFGVGFLSGGYGREELERAGAVRAYEDPADFLKHIDQVGGRW
jgi:phosphoglycolate phosphatase-like HAD superfamily hydrolase